MDISSLTQRTLALLHTQGILRTSDIDTISAQRVVLVGQLSSSWQLERLGCSLYHLSAVKAPKDVFCWLTTLQFRELTKQLFRQVWIAMLHGCHTSRIEHPPNKMVWMAGNAHASGIDEHEREGPRLRIYSAARTMANDVKRLNQISLELAIEAQKAACKTRKASADDLWRHAKVCWIANISHPYLETVSHGTRLPHPHYIP